MKEKINISSKFPAEAASIALGIGEFFIRFVLCIGCKLNMRVDQLLL